jgi:transposase
MMIRKHLLAAELFSYSYANYADHLGIGNIRFEKLMPETFEVLERGVREGWNDSQLAKALEVEEGTVEEWKGHYQRAKEIIEAPNAAESFRRGVRHSIQYQVKEGLKTEEEIEKLVTQICYRAADLAVLLENEKTVLSDYSQELRRESRNE